MGSMHPALVLLLAAGAYAAEERPLHIGAAASDDLELVDEGRWVEAVSRRRQRIENAPQPVTVLTERDLILSPAVTLADRLRYVAGVDVYQGRHGQFDVGMRGWNGLLNNRVLVLVEDRQFRQEEYGSVLWRGVLNQSDLRRVEIIKGPSAVSYGADAFGGVIALKERIVGDRPELHLLGYAGSPLAGEADATALIPMGATFYAKASAGGTYLTDFDGTSSGLPYTGSPYAGHTGDTDLASIRYAGMVGMHLSRGYRMEVNYHGSDVNSWEMIDDVDAGSNDTSFKDDTLTARIVGPWGSLRHLHHVSDKTYQNQKPYFDPANAFRYTQAGFAVVEDQTRLQIDLPLDVHQLSFGGEYDTWRSASNLWDESGDFFDSQTWASIKTTNAALFTELQLALHPSLLLTTGVRADDNSEVGTNVSPRVALNFKPDDDQFALLSYSSGYRLPSPIETDIAEYYFASSEDLKAEKIQAVELNWQRRFNTTATIALGGFYNYANDLIWPLPLGAADMAANYYGWLAAGPDLSVPPGPFFEFTNLDDPVETYGLEASGRVSPFEAPVALWGNATWQEFAYQDPIRLQSPGFFDPVSGGTIFAFDQTLPEDVGGPPPWKFNLGVTWDTGTWFSGCALRYVAAREQFRFADSWFGRGGPIAIAEVPAYSCFDLMVGWQLGPTHPGCFVKLGILDVFDSNHYEQAKSSTWTLANSVESQAASEIGRQFALQGGWAF